MKRNQSISVMKPILLAAITFYTSIAVSAQEAITRDASVQDTIIQDTIVQNIIVQDTAIQETIVRETSVQDTIIQDTSVQDLASQDKSQKERKEKKRKDSFKVYGGATFSDLGVSPDLYESTGQFGYNLGVSYKRSKFLYYEFGARYCRSVYQLTSLIIPGEPIDGEGTFSMSTVDIPINGGINLTSFVDRILGVRIFIGIVPAFRIGVKDNSLGITKNTTNTFIFSGQGGVGLDVAFIFLEAGFNYGFIDLLNNDMQSTPRQIYVNLGFRF